MKQISTYLRVHILLLLLIIGAAPVVLQAQDLSGSTWRSTFDHTGAKGYISYHFTSAQAGYYEYSVKSIFKDYNGRGDFTYRTDDGRRYIISDVEHPDDPDYKTQAKISGQLLTLSMPPRVEQMVEGSPGFVRKILDEYLSDMLSLQRQVMP